MLNAIENELYRVSKSDNHKFCEKQVKCCSICMNKYTHLCKNSCFYKVNFSCDECEYLKDK